MASKLYYKGFDPGYWCRGHKFLLGVKYSAEGKVILCGNGFHACADPREVFNHYTGPLRVYGKVRLSGDLRTDGDKTVARSITLVKTLSFEQMMLECSRSELGIREVEGSGYRKTYRSTNNSRAIVDAQQGGSALASLSLTYLGTTGYTANAVSTGPLSKALSYAPDSSAIATGGGSVAEVQKRASLAVTTGIESVARAEGSGSVAVSRYAASACEGSHFIIIHRNSRTRKLESAIGVPGVDGIEPDTVYVIKKGKLVKDERYNR